MSDPITAATRIKAVPAVTMTEILNGLLDDMKAALLAAGVTVPIYIGYTPPEPGTCLTLYEYSGQPPATLINIETPGLQVKIRQEAGLDDYQAGRTLAAQVQTALHDKKNFTTGRSNYIHITAQQSVFALPRDENNRPIFTVNFLVKSTPKK